MHFFDKRIISHFDYLIIIFILPLIYLSYHLISETNVILANKQLIYFSISFAAFLFVFILPIRNNLGIIPFLYWVGIALLLAVEFFGITKPTKEQQFGWWTIHEPVKHGAQDWREERIIIFKQTKTYPRWRCETGKTNKR